MYPIPLPISRRLSIKSSTASSSATCALGKFVSKAIVELRLRILPTANSPITMGCINACPLLNRNSSPVSSPCRWSIHTDVSTTIMTARSAAEVSASAAVRFRAVLSTAARLLHESRRATPLSPNLHSPIFRNTHGLLPAVRHRCLVWFAWRQTPRFRQYDGLSIGGIRHNHAGSLRRRGIGFSCGSLPPNLARRRAASRSTIAFNPWFTNTSTSDIPEYSLAFASSSSSMFSVVRMAANTSFSAIRWSIHRGYYPPQS